MGQFVLFMISFNVDAEIQADVVRYAECIAVAVKNVVRIVVIELPDRIGYGSSGLIGKVQGGTVAPGKLIIRNQADVVGTVVIGRKEISIVDPLLRILTVVPDQGP